MAPITILICIQSNNSVRVDKGETLSCSTIAIKRFYKAHRNGDTSGEMTLYGVTLLATF